MKYLLPLALALLTSSCLEKPSLSEDKGPQASTSEVFQAVAEAWGDAEPSTIRKDEFSYKERIQTIQGGSPYLVSQEGVTVAKRDLNLPERRVDYTFLQQVAEIVDGESKVSTTSHDISVDLPAEFVASGTGDSQTLLRAQDVKIQSLIFGVEIVASLANVCVMTPELAKDCQDAGADSCRLTCHNLKVSEEITSPPALVRNQENCGGVPNCRMKRKNVSFDLVLDMKRGDSIEQQKVTYMVGISPDAPYMSRLMNYCYRGVVQVPNSAQRVLVTICNEVKNFKLGQSYCDNPNGCSQGGSSVE